MRLVSIIAALALCGCAVNQSYPPIQGAAACWQFAEHEPSNPILPGGMAEVTYDCSTLKVISSTAWPTSSFASSLPPTVIGGAASATVPMIAK